MLECNQLRLSHAEHCETHNERAQLPRPNLYRSALALNSKYRTTVFLCQAPTVIPGSQLRRPTFAAIQPNTRSTRRSPDCLHVNIAVSHFAPSIRAFLPQMSKIYGDRRGGFTPEGYGEEGAEAELGLCGSRLGASAWLLPQQGQERELCRRSMLYLVSASLAPSVGLLRSRPMREDFTFRRGASWKKVVFGFSVPFRNDTKLTR